jgi:hypothetical protein
MAISSTFGQQTRASHGARQIWPSFYSCWGTKATKSPCYECSNFEQPHARQKQNEKKALDRVKKKVELEWNELQARAQQMEQVKLPLLVRLASEILLSIIGIPTWGAGFIPQSAWACLKKDKNLVETIRASRVAYAKPLKLAWGARNWTLESNKHNRVKELDAISKYHDSEIIHGRHIPIPFFQF